MNVMMSDFRWVPKSGSSVALFRNLPITHGTWQLVCSMMLRSKWNTTVAHKKCGLMPSVHKPLSLKSTHQWWYCATIFSTMKYTVSSTSQSRTSTCLNFPGQNDGVVVQVDGIVDEIHVEILVIFQSTLQGIVTWNNTATTGLRSDRITMMWESICHKPPEHYQIKRYTDQELENNFKKLKVCGTHESMHSLLIISIRGH